MARFTYAQKALVKCIVANLMIKRIPESQIIKKEYDTESIITKETSENILAQMMEIYSFEETDK